MTSFSGTIDGENTNVYDYGGSGAVLFAVGSTDNVTFSNIKFGATGSSSSSYSVLVSGGSAAFVHVDAQAGIQSSGGSVTISDSTIERFVNKVTGTMTVQSSTITGLVYGDRGAACQVIGNRFDGGYVEMVASPSTIENNVFTMGSNDAISADGPTVVEFNTFVNSSGATAAVYAVAVDSFYTNTCDSNIVAWSSATPLQNCTTISYSLFDTASAVPTGSAAGSGNFNANVATFFANLAGSDFHLASGSPAKAKADPAATLTTDYDGNPRPNPAGSHPDIGAYEAP